MRPREEVHSQPQSTRSPEEPARCLPAAAGWSRKPASEPSGRGVCWDPTPRPWLLQAHFLEVLPRRAGSHPLALCVRRSSPNGPLASPQQGSAGERPAGRSPPARLTGKPQEQPRRSANPGNPSPGALREGRGLRIQTARRPPRRRVRDLVEKQNRQGKARPELAGEIEKPRPPVLGWGIGNLSRNPRLGARSQPLAKERYSRVEHLTPVSKVRRGCTQLPPLGLSPRPPSLTRPPARVAVPLRSPGRQARLREPLLWQPASCGGFMNIPGRGS